MAGEAAAGGDTQISLEGLWARVLRGPEGRLPGRGGTRLKKTCCKVESFRHYSTHLEGAGWHWLRDNFLTPGVRGGAPRRTA